jgi:hypothetical protein
MRTRAAETGGADSEWHHRKILQRGDSAKVSGRKLPEAFMAPRFKLPPVGDVPPVAAARRMGLSHDAFRDVLPDLVARGFPQPDETTGNFDLDAIDIWRRTRNPHLFPGLLGP